MDDPITGDVENETSAPDLEERRNNWSFFENINGTWTWWLERPNGRSAASRSAFASMMECIADAERNGYVLPPSTRERRAAPNRPPTTIISQELWCPECKYMAQLGRDEFVSRNDYVKCPKCGHKFVATPENVTCCVEDGEGLREIPLP